MKIYYKTWFIMLFAITIIGIPVAMILIYLQNKYISENYYNRDSEHAITELIKVKKLYDKLQVREEKLNLEVAKLELKLTKLTDLSDLDSEKQKYKEDISQLESDLDALKDEYIELREEVLIQEHGLYVPNFRYELPSEYKEKLDCIQADIKKLIADKQSYIITVPMKLDKSTKKGKAMQDRNGKQLVRNYLAETDETLRTITAANYHSKIKRVEKSFNQLNKMNRDVNVEISPQMKKLVEQKLKLLIEYKLFLADEKEKAAEEKRILREEEKVQKEIDKMKKGIDKELSKYQKEKIRLEELLENEKDNSKVTNQLNALEQKITLLKNKDIELENRLQNTRAGYVYVISNVGSFGENIFKIGVTRRQEPMDRIRELSSASVPFKFDVHALIFSDDAYRLENELHKCFRTKSVNQVNFRKEFFNVELAEIQKVVSEKFNKTVNFTTAPEALEFRQSQTILQSLK